MEYIFTDWDDRTYEKKTKDKAEISIEAEHISSGKVKISLKESGKSFVDLFLSRKEAAGIINSLGSANSECKCVITI